MTNITSIAVAKNRIVDDNLKNIIKKSREIIIHHDALQWESNCWGQSIRFYRLPINRISNQFMRGEFMLFSKSYITNKCLFKKNIHAKSITALRVIEAALWLTYKSDNICEVDMKVLEQAMTITTKRYSTQYSYAIGCKIKEIVDFLIENNLVYKNIKAWFNPLREKKRYIREVGNEKLPNEEIIKAFAEIFSKKLYNERDIFTTSVVALLMSAPARISEILSLRSDCLIQDETKNRTIVYGMRFWAGKGYGGDIKWITNSMIYVVRKAIVRLKYISRRARRYAKKMELAFEVYHKKSKLSTLSHHQLLTATQVYDSIFQTPLTKNECKRKLKNTGLMESDYYYTSKSLWEELQKRLPNGFPWYDNKKNIKYSELLSLFFKDQFHKVKSANVINIYAPSRSFFSHDYEVKEDRNNIFQRHGIDFEGKGKKNFRSHQVRHLLNTIAQQNGMSEYEVAKWSGRKKISQNRIYNHENLNDYLDIYQCVLNEQKDCNMFQIEEAISDSEVNDNNDFISKITEYGSCIKLGV